MAQDTTKYTLYTGDVTLNGVKCKNPSIELLKTDDCISVQCIDESKGKYEIKVKPGCEVSCLDFVVKCNPEDCADCGQKIITKCLSDNGCPDCHKDINGFCEPICPELLCDAVLGCVDCLNDEDCPEGLECLNGSCVCSNGTFPDAEGNCVECDETTALQNCTVCINGKIVDKDCLDGQTCDPVTGDCEDCVNSGDCGPNQICQNNECVCAPGFIYDKSIEDCVIEPECYVDGDCGPCKVCQGGKCVDRPCPTGQVCDPNSDGCIPECDCGTGPCDETSACVDLGTGKCGCIDCSTLSCLEEGTAGGCQSGSDLNCYCSDEGDCLPNPCVNQTCNNGFDCGEDCGCLDGQCVPCDSLPCTEEGCEAALGCGCNGTCGPDPDPCSNYSCDETTGPAACQGGSDSRPDCGCDENGDCVQQPCEGEFTLIKDDENCTLEATLTTNKCCDCPDITVDNKITNVDTVSNSEGIVSYLFEIRKGKVSSVVDINSLSLVSDTTKPDILFNEEPLSGRVDICTTNEYVDTTTVSQLNPDGTTTLLSSTPTTRLGTETVVASEILLQTDTYTGDFPVTIVGTQTGQTTTVSGNITTIVTSDLVGVRVTYKLTSAADFPSGCEYEVQNLFSYTLNEQNWSQFSASVEGTVNQWREKKLTTAEGQCANPVFEWQRAPKGSIDFELFRRHYVAPTAVGLYEDYLDKPDFNLYSSPDSSVLDNHGELWSGYIYRVFSSCGCDTEAVLETCGGVLAFCDLNTPEIEILDCGRAFRFLEPVQTKCISNYFLGSDYPEAAQVQWEIVVNGTVIPFNGENTTAELSIGQHPTPATVYNSTEIIEVGELISSIAIRNIHSECCDVDIQIPVFDVPQKPTSDKRCESDSALLEYTSDLSQIASIEFFSDADLTSSFSPTNYDEASTTYTFNYSTLQAAGTASGDEYIVYIKYTFEDGCILEDIKNFTNQCCDCEPTGVTANQQVLDCDKYHLDFIINSLDCNGNAVAGRYDLEFVSSIPSNNISFSLDYTPTLYQTSAYEFIGTGVGVNYPRFNQGPASATVGGGILTGSGQITGHTSTTDGSSISHTPSWAVDSTGNLHMWVSNLFKNQPTWDLGYESINISFTPTSSCSDTSVSTTKEVDEAIYPPDVIVENFDIETCGSTYDLEIGGFQSGSSVNYTLSNGGTQTIQEVGGLVTIPVTGTSGSTTVVTINSIGAPSGNTDSTGYVDKPYQDCGQEILVSQFNVEFLEQITATIGVTTPGNYCTDDAADNPVTFTVTGATGGTVDLVVTRDGNTVNLNNISPEDGYTFINSGDYEIISVTYNYIDCDGNNATTSAVTGQTFTVTESGTISITQISSSVASGDNCNVTLQVASNTTFTFSGATLDNQNGNQYSFNNVPNGTVITATTEGPCSATDEYTVNCDCDTIAPPTIVGGTDQEYCSSEVGATVTGNTVAGNTIEWTGGGTTITSTTGQSVTLSAGSYTVISIDPSTGCESPAVTVEVVENDIPVVNNNFVVGGPQNCVADPIVWASGIMAPAGFTSGTLIVEDSLGAQSYTNTVTSTTSTGNIGGTITANTFAAGTYTGKLTITDNNGCVSEEVTDTFVVEDCCEDCTYRMELFDPTTGSTTEFTTCEFFPDKFDPLETRYGYDIRARLIENCPSTGVDTVIQTWDEIDGPNGIQPGSTYYLSFQNPNEQIDIEIFDNNGSSLVTVPAFPDAQDLANYLTSNTGSYWVSSGTTVRMVFSPNNTSGINPNSTVTTLSNATVTINQIVGSQGLAYYQTTVCDTNTVIRRALTKDFTGENDLTILTYNTADTTCNPWIPAVQTQGTLFDISEVTCADCE